MVKRCSARNPGGCKARVAPTLARLPRGPYLMQLRVVRLPTDDAMEQKSTLPQRRGNIEFGHKFALLHRRERPSRETNAKGYRVTGRSQVILTTRRRPTARRSGKWMWERGTAANNVRAIRPHPRHQTHDMAAPSGLRKTTLPLYDVRCPWQASGNKQPIWIATRLGRCPPLQCRQNWRCYPM